MRRTASCESSTSHEALDGPGRATASLVLVMPDAMAVSNVHNVEVLPGQRVQNAEGTESNSPGWVEKKDSGLAPKTHGDSSADCDADAEAANRSGVDLSSGAGGKPTKVESGREAREASRLPIT